MHTKKQAVISQGDYKGYCIPRFLYHGTHSLAFEKIQESGLDVKQANPDSIGITSCQGGNYLTTSLSIASSFARSRAHRNGCAPVVLSIDAGDLNPDFLYFDWNMSGGRFWTEALVYSKKIEINAIEELDIDTLAHANSELMQLTEPEPGARPLAWDLTWNRSSEFLAFVDVENASQNCENQERLPEPTPD